LLVLIQKRKYYQIKIKPAVAIKFSFSTAPPHLCVLEKPKNDVLRTDTCQGYRPKGAFLPPTILVSGRAKTCERPHSAFLAADSVYLPGMGFSGGKGSVGIVFSKTSVELIELGLCVVVVETRVLKREGVVTIKDCWVVMGFTGFAFIC
jgi:hypothetical protein